jgi:hypothetical protein
MDINSINSYNGIYVNNKKQDESENKKAEKMSKTNEILLASIQFAEDHNDVKAILKSAVKNNRIKQIGTLLYQADDYIYADLLKFYGEPQANNLKKVAEKDIKIAPKFVDLIEKGNYSVLVTKIDGLNGKDLIPFSQGYNLLSEDAKKSAYADVQKLLGAGIINQDMLRGDNAWYVNPETKEIVVPFWDKIRPTDTNEAPQILDTLYKTIFKK